MNYTVGPNHDTLEEMLVRLYLWDEEEFIA